MKHSKNIFLILFLISLLPCKLFSQDNYVFAPFVSRLKAVENDSSIKLSWKDSRDIDGSYLIYRNTEKITRNNFSDSFLVAEVPSGVGRYTDTAMENTDFFYTVLVKSREGKIYDIFIPFRNVTSRPVTVKNINRISDNRAIVTYLRVTEKKDSLYITFNSSNPERNVAILRNISPIFSVEDSKESTLLSIIPSSKESYSDFPIPGVPYYYCVVDAELLKSFNFEIVPFENSTISPSEIRLSEETIISYQNAVQSRPVPLPALILDKNIVTGKSLSANYEYVFPEKELSGKIKTAVKTIISKIDTTDEMVPEILNSEDFYNNRENIQLSMLIDKYFMKNDWESLEIKLYDFIRTNNKKSLKNKARFYLGQSYYFRNEYNKAYLEFLTSSESFYPESHKWMEHILIQKY